MARLRHSLFLVMRVDRLWCTLHLAFVQAAGQYGLLGLPGPSFVFPGDRPRQNMQNTEYKTILSCKHIQWLDGSPISWGRRLQPLTEARMKVQRKNYQENIVTPYFVYTGVGLLVFQGKEKVTTAWAQVPIPCWSLKKIINFYINGYFACLYVCTMCAVSIETRRECWNL